MYLYDSITSPKILRESSPGEVDKILHHYRFLTNYEKIEQKYSLICNKYTDLCRDVVTISHKIINSPTSSAILMYGCCELNRRIFNLLSSYYAYYEFLDEMYMQNISGISIVDFKKSFSVYRDGNEQLAFSWSLRHYYNHHDFPVHGIRSYFNRQEIPPIQSPIIFGLELVCNKTDLLKSRFDWSWKDTVTAKKYLEKQPDRFDLLPIIHRSYAAWTEIHGNIRDSYVQNLRDSVKFINDLFFRLR